MPKLKPGAKWPTRADWIESKGKRSEPGDKMIQLRKDAEERARIKVEQIFAENGVDQ